MIRDGQTPAERFEVFLSPHFDALHRAAYRLSGNIHDAEDLVQEVCVKAYPRIDELERLKRPRSWLLRVLYNLFVDTTRRWENANVTSLSVSEDHDSSMLMASTDPGPEECADALILGALMDQAWQRMERRQRALLHNAPPLAGPVAPWREGWALQAAGLGDTWRFLNLPPAQALLTLPGPSSRERPASARRGRVGLAASSWPFCFWWGLA